jgi:pyroglutamyl-peptidase
MFRDFLDGKFDGAGHPLNARVIDGATLCGSTRLDATCTASLPGAEQSGDLVVNARLRVDGAPDDGDIITVSVGTASDTLTVARLRERADWIDLPVGWSSDGSQRQIVLAPAQGAVVDLDYIEVFPKRFGLVLGPGSGVYADADHLTFETQLAHKVAKIDADGVDVTDAFDALLAAGTATKTTTEFRVAYDVAVGDLLPSRGDVSELHVHTDLDAARMQLRREVAPCEFVGDPAGTKVLITGFQPFPADGWHDNVSGVAVTAVDPSHVPGAQIMKLVIPVEYDRAAATVADAIARCQPALVISFGQGGGDIALEEVAYNLQDTGELSGGVPDNRGIVRSATPIDTAAPATRDTLLPLDKIQPAIEALGESPQHSRDPGRYICNNVFFVDVGAMAGRGKAGFIHLPYTSEFDDSVRARFAAVVEAAVRASL